MKDKKFKVIVDRPYGSKHPLNTTLTYTLNYGYIAGMIAGDGEEQDAYIMDLKYPVKEYEGSLIAIVHRINDVEDKWVIGRPGADYSVDEITNEILFQEHFFEFEIIMVDR